MYEDFTENFTTKGENKQTPDIKLSIDEQSKSPKSNQIDVNPATTKEISFKFNKEMDDKTITTTTVKLFENGIAFSPTHVVNMDENDKSKVIINPNKNLNPKTKYTIKVGPGVKDTKGNTLEKEESWSFTTKGENKQTPDIKLSIDEQSKSPKSNQIDVDPATTKEISFKFNKEMDDKTITTTNVKLFEGNTEMALRPDSLKPVENDKSKVIINPNKNLNPKTKYTIKVGPGVKDTKGNTLEKEESWMFTTG